ncbi:MAG: guanylate kinase [Myxococcota bacterium]
MLCKGLAIVLSAPSGAGKTTLAKRLVSVMSPRLCLSVSYTTRPKRSNEQHAVDYHFISRQQFEGMVRKNDFLEWAHVHGHLYGSSLDWTRDMLHKGRDVLFVLDVQGGEQLRKRLPNCVLVFIVPPSLQHLEQRLRQRKTESASCIEQRMQTAQREISFGLQHYDYVVVNDQLETAQEDLQAIVRVHRLLQVDRQDLQRRFLSGLPIELSK